MAVSSTSDKTLLQAIKDKYCDSISGETCDESTMLRKGPINESAMVYKPGGCAIGRRHSIVLDGCGVKCVGSGSELATLCPNVKELHLAGNEMNSWEDVCVLLSSMPLLTLMDLSHNPLHSDSFNTAPIATGRHDQLTTLVLNSTDISWSTLQTFLQMFPNLQELRLCNNNYLTVNFDPSFSVPSLQRLFMNNTRLSEWAELAKLSSAFPGLQSLVMCDSPLEEVPLLEVPCGDFKELLVLNLNGSRLSDWTSVEHLSALDKLTELNLLKVPLGVDLEDKERRFAIIARLPSLSKLNKSSISATEREDAERWFIRQFSGTHHPLVAVLTKKHGQVDHLAEVNMTKKKRVMLQFHFDGNCESHEIDLMQSTKQLKSWIGKTLVGMPPSTFRIFYHDPDCWTGSEEMKIGSKQLYTYYPMNENDQIHIEMKLLRTRQ